jgi:hypothetical protein
LRERSSRGGWVLLLSSSLFARALIAWWLGSVV